MKKIFTILCIAGIAGNMSCKFDLEDDPALTPTYSTFSFTTATATVTEGEQVSVTIKRSNDAYEGTIALEVVTTGSKITVPAVEGTDFTLSKTVQFNGRYTSEDVVITALENGQVFGDGKQFGLRLTQGEGAVQLSADTLWVNIEEVDDAFVAFENTYDLVITEDGLPVTVTIVRTGAEFAGTVTLEGVGTGVNPALPSAYVLSPVVFELGETTKTATITPAADDGDFTGNATFAVKIKSAGGAKIKEEDQDQKINVTVIEAGGFAALQTFLAGTFWESHYYDFYDEGYYYTISSFAATAVDSVYNYTFDSALPAIQVRFSKQDYSMTIDLPQNPSARVNTYYTRWMKATLSATGPAAVTTAVKLTIPFGWVDFSSRYNDSELVFRGYELPADFVLGLGAYTTQGRTNLAGFFVVNQEHAIVYWP
jgi:hypothetical protein